jgi:hypothetical protein
VPVTSQERSCIFGVPILPLVLLFFNHILNCSDRVVFLKNIYFGLFRQCGIFFLLYCGLFRQCTIFLYHILDCSDSVVVWSCFLFPLCLFTTEESISSLCSVTSRIPTCQKSNSTGLYHLVKSRFPKVQSKI